MSLQRTSSEEQSSPVKTSKFKAIFRLNSPSKSSKETNLEKCFSETDVFFYNKNVSKVFQQNLKTNFDLQQQNIESSKRNSRSEENLLEMSDKIEFKKSNSCEKNNEIKEETEDILAKALRRRLEQGEFKITKNSDELDFSEKLDSPKLSENQIHNSNELINNSEEDKMMPPMQHSQSGSTDSQGLIVPKKLINPCLESNDRQNLHRELMFNQKVGRSVLNQKTELQKALEKQKERQIIAQQQQQQPHQLPFSKDGLHGELGRVIMQRAQRMEQKSLSQQDELTGQFNPELMSARAKLRHTIDTK